MAAYTIDSLTVKDRILLYLSRFSNIVPGQTFNVPYDVTQDGIAIAVGITRAHVSIDLKRLYETGMVTNWRAHQKGQRAKRLVYSITDGGKARAEETAVKLRANGIDVDAILRRPENTVDWAALGASDRDAFGKVCVMRIPVPAELFDKESVKSLRPDSSGRIFIPSEVARRFLDRASPAEIGGWNSWAADYWMQEGNPQERLYHLVEAGRKAEAGRFACLRMNELLSNPNEDLLRSLNLIGSDYRYEDILWMRSQVAYCCRNQEELRRCSRELGKLKSPREFLTEGQLEMLRKDYRSAYGMAEKAYEFMHDPDSAVLMSRTKVRMGDLAEADRLAAEACEAMRRLGEAGAIDEILKVRAEIAYRNGDPDSACALLGKAEAAAPDYRRKDLHSLCEAVRDPDSAVVFD